MAFIRLYLFSFPFFAPPSFADDREGSIPVSEEEGMDARIRHSVHFFYPSTTCDEQLLSSVGFAALVETLPDDIGNTGADADTKESYFLSSAVESRCDTLGVRALGPQGGLRLGIEVHQRTQQSSDRPGDDDEEDEEEVGWTSAHVECWLRRLEHLCDVVAGESWAKEFIAQTERGSASLSSTVRDLLQTFSIFLDAIVCAREGEGPEMETRRWLQLAEIDACVGFPTVFLFNATRPPVNLDEGVAEELHSDSGDVVVLLEGDGLAVTTVSPLGRHDDDDIFSLVGGIRLLALILLSTQDTPLHSYPAGSLGDGLVFSLTLRWRGGAVVFLQRQSTVEAAGTQGSRFIFHVRVEKASKTESYQGVGEREAALDRCRLQNALNWANECSAVGLTGPQWFVHFEWRGASIGFGRLSHSFPALCEALGQSTALHDTLEEMLLAPARTRTADFSCSAAPAAKLPDVEWCLSSSVCCGVVHAEVGPISRLQPSPDLFGGPQATKCWLCSAGVMTWVSIRCKPFYDAMEECESALFAVVKSKIFCQP